MAARSWVGVPGSSRKVPRDAATLRVEGRWAIFTTFVVVKVLWLRLTKKHIFSCLFTLF